MSLFAEAMGRIKEGVAKLPIHLTHVAHLRYIQGYTLRETAHIMNMSVELVDSLTLEASRLLLPYAKGEVDAAHTEGLARN